MSVCRRRAGDTDLRASHQRRHGPRHDPDGPHHPHGLRGGGGRQDRHDNPNNAQERIRI